MGLVAVVGVKEAFLFMSLFLCIGSVKGAMKTMEQTLINDLFTGYNKDAHPIPLRQNRSLYTVTFGLELVQLVNVDDKNQIITVNVWVRQKWRNMLLTWNPDNYGGIKRIRIDPSLVWIPDIVLYSSADSEFSGGLEKYKTRVRLDHEGTCGWYSPASFRSTCPIDVTYFPFDEQKCVMKFGSWTFEMVDLDIRADNTPLYSSQYMKSAEWDLVRASRERNVELYACCENPFSDVTIEFVFRRKPLFYIFNLILPCIIIMATVLLGFLLPPESGERITLSITVLLAMAVFLQLAAENLPRNSEHVPLLGIFYITVMGEVALSILCTCYVLHIHHSNSGTAVVPVPSWVTFYILDGLGRFLGVKKPIIIDKYDATSEKDFRRLSKMRSGDTDCFYSVKEDRDSIVVKLLGEKSTKTRKETFLSQKRGEEYVMNEVRNQRGEASAEQKIADMNVMSNDVVTLNAKAVQGILVLADRIKHQRDIEKNQEEWRHLAMILDRMFFWMFVALIVVTTVIILKMPGH